MSVYPNVLTPPSSNEDSPPQPVYHNMDNNPINFNQADNYEAVPIATFDIFPQTSMIVDPNMTSNRK